MAQAKEGDRVRVHYTGKLDDGSVFDSSECYDEGCECETGPLEFTIGAGEVIDGFDRAIVGMAPGDEKTVHIPVDEAYGPRLDEMLAVMERKDLPADMDPAVGEAYEITQADGTTFPVVVAEVTDSQVTLDANHPLAGRDLTFELKLVEII